LKKEFGIWLGAMLAAAGCMVRPVMAEPAEAPDESVFLANWSGGSELAVSSPEAVAWTLRYPTLFSSRTMTDGAWLDAMQAYEQGRLVEAMITFDQVPPDARNASYRIYHAHFLLLTGNEKEARAELDRALSLAPDSAEAWSLRAIMDLRQGRAKEALQHADRAVTLGPDLPAAHLAKSYALQAKGALAGATASAERVLALEPDSALAHVRLAELELAAGHQQAALTHALKAVELGPSLPDARDALGFVRLSLNQPAEAVSAFKEAERLNELDPSAHFGMGLAYIRGGHLVQGREQLEKAVNLAPSSALPHTYLGRAYDLEGRGKEASAEYEQAAKIDPRDPVPYRFDAIRLAADNAPVAGRDRLQSALDRLGNRAVYRSQALLAKDRALYLSDMSDLDGVLGLDDRSWLDAVQAMSEDFNSGAAHLAAGDALAVLPRTGVARQSEYLQAALREPLGVLPPPLSVAEGIEPGSVAPQQGFFRAASPDRTGYNEFGAVFNAAASNLDLDVTGGGQGSLGDQLRAAKAVGNAGLSFSQIHFESNGFGQYDGLDNSAWRGMLQYDLSPATRLHLEYQGTDQQRMGVLLPNDALFSQPQAIDEQRERSRFALRHDFSESSQVVLLASEENLKQTIGNLPTANNYLASARNDRQTVRSDVLEAQYLYQLADWRFVAGVSHVRENQMYAYGAADYGIYGTYPESTNYFCSMPRQPMATPSIEPAPI
jgi:tetratricopeptide (TPR) repeat protein